MTRPNLYRLRRHARVARERHALRHLRQHFEMAIAARHTKAPAWDRGPVDLDIKPPRKLPDGKRFATMWGVPLLLSDLDALPLLSDGGWRIFNLPPTPVLHVHAVKASVHTYGLPYLRDLALVSLFSRLTLSEAAAFSVDLMQLDPAREYAPSGSANAWAEVGITIVNTWQSRQERHGGRGLGDVARIAEAVADIRDTCALRQIRQAEIDLEAARAGRYSRVTTDRATMGLGRPESPPGSTGAASGENHPPGEETD